MSSSERQSLSNRIERKLKDEQTYMDVVSVSDWVMAQPYDDNYYILPFQMQGCVFT